MPPEALAGGELSQAVDAYSFGARSWCLGT